MLIVFFFSLITCQTLYQEPKFKWVISPEN